jgi:hypothetical protein
LRVKTFFPESAQNESKHSWPCSVIAMAPDTLELR